jgi:arylsulfatase A-like enzyme
MRSWSGPWRGTYFTALEGSLRVPFIIRRPGKIPAGGVSNEIVHEMDLFTTLAAILAANYYTTISDRQTFQGDMPTRLLRGCLEGICC